MWLTEYEIKTYNMELVFVNNFTFKDKAIIGLGSLRETYTQEDWTSTWMESTHKKRGKNIEKKQVWKNQVGR